MTGSTKHFTDAELAAEEVMSSNDYDGDGPESGNSGYHFTGGLLGDDEVIIERQVFQRFMSRPHAHENGYQ